MEDDEMMQLTKALSANVPLSKRNDDVRSIFSVCSKGSNVSRSSAAAHENARLQKVLSEKKVEQLKRGKARRLKEEQLKLENQIAEAEDAVELAKTNVQFYEGLEDPLGGSISRTNSVQDLNCEEQLKNIKPKRIIKESMEEKESWKLWNINPRLRMRRQNCRNHLQRNHYLRWFHYLAQPQVEQQCQSLVLRNVV